MADKPAGDRALPRSDPANDAASHAAPAVPDDVVLSDRMVTSDALFAGRSQLAIKHNQAIYFLRQTRFGKLILTK